MQQDCSMLHASIDQFRTAQASPAGRYPRPAATARGCCAAPPPACRMRRPAAPRAAQCARSQRGPRWPHAAPQLQIQSHLQQCDVGTHTASHHTQQLQLAVFIVDWCARSPPGPRCCPAAPLPQTHLQHFGATRGFHSHMWADTMFRTAATACCISSALFINAASARQDQGSGVDLACSPSIVDTTHRAAAFADFANVRIQPAPCHCCSVKCRQAYCFTKQVSVLLCL